MWLSGRSARSRNNRVGARACERAARRMNDETASIETHVRWKKYVPILRFESELVEAREARLDLLQPVRRDLVPGREHERLLVRRHRTLAIVEALERVAQVVPRRDVPGLQLDGSLELRHGRVELVRLEVPEPQRVVDLPGPPGPPATAPPPASGCARPAVHLLAQHDGAHLEVLLGGGAPARMRSPIALADASSSRRISTWRTMMNPANPRIASSDPR